MLSTKCVPPATNSLWEFSDLEAVRESPSLKTRAENTPRGPAQGRPRIGETLTRQEGVARKIAAFSAREGLNVFSEPQRLTARGSDLRGRRPPWLRCGDPEFGCITRRHRGAHHRSGTRRRQNYPQGRAFAPEAVACLLRLPRTTHARLDAPRRWRRQAPSEAGVSIPACDAGPSRSRAQAIPRERLCQLQGVPFLRPGHGPSHPGARERWRHG